MRNSFLIWVIFEGIALSLYVSTKNLFYLFNFSYIETCIGVGTSLMSKDTFNKTGYRHHLCQIDLYNLPVSEVMKHVYRI